MEPLHCPNCGSVEITAEGACADCFIDLKVSLAQTHVGAPAVGSDDALKVTHQEHPAQPTAARTDPLLGQLVADKFLVSGKVGAGGIGRVYRAVQQGLERPVALKVLHPELALDDDHKQRFHREARAASRLNHPGAVTVYDFGEWQDQLYIAMEFIQGESMFDLLEAEFPFAPERMVELLGQVCQVLTVAHDQGLVHRDLKPDNIMVIHPDANEPTREQVKVVDFGLAILVGPEAEERMTQEGLITGTPAYMSPEQVRGTEMDTRSDLYSLGVILYELLCQEIPFTGRNATDLIIKHLFNEPEPPSARVEGVTVPPALERLALHAMAKDPDHRPQTAAEFGALLQEALAQIQSSKGSLPAQRKVGLQAGDRSARADAMGLPRKDPAGDATPTQDAARVLVLEASTGELTLTLRANGLNAAGPVALDQVAAWAAKQQYEAVVVHLVAPAAEALEILARSLDQGLLHQLPVVAVGPPEAFELMSRALELGLVDYLTHDKLARKLPKILRRLRRRKGDRGPGTGDR